MQRWESVLSNYRYQLAQKFPTQVDWVGSWRGLFYAIITQKTVAFYTSRDRVFYGDHGWLSRQSVEIHYWKNCIRVIREFFGWFPLLVVTFGGLSLIRILNFMWRVMAYAKIVKICLRLVNYIHGNVRKALVSSAHGLCWPDQGQVDSGDCSCLQ